MKTASYFYLRYVYIFVMFCTLVLAYGPKVDVVWNNPKQHNLSCEKDSKIEIQRGSQVFNTNFTDCDFNNHSCSWLPDDRKHRFCSSGDALKLSFMCDGNRSCNIESPVDPGIRCCQNNNSCENRLGYKIEYKCIPGLQKLDLSSKQEVFSISGQDIVIKAPHSSERKCSCHVKIKPTKHYFRYKFYFHADTNNYIATDFTNIKAEKTFIIDRTRNILMIILKTRLDVKENESILNVTCSCGSVVGVIKSTSANTLKKSFIKSSSNNEVLTSTISAVETQANPVDSITSEGNNMVIIVSVVGAGLVLIVTLIIIVFILKKRTTTSKHQANNSNSDVQALPLAVPEVSPGAVRGDLDYIRLSETRNVQQEVINTDSVCDIYNHIGPTCNRPQNNDNDDYNHIGDIKGNNSRVADDNYDHVEGGGANASYNLQQGNDTHNQISIKKEGATYAVVNKKDNSNRIETSNDVEVGSPSAQSKGGNFPRDDVEYAVVKKNSRRK